MLPRVSVIIPWCNRKNIGHTLSRNRPALEESGAELLVVNFGGDRAMLADLLGAPTPRWLRFLGFQMPSLLLAGETRV